jgi:hypothetical protein
MEATQLTPIEEYAKSKLGDDDYERMNHLASWLRADLWDGPQDYSEDGAPCKGFVSGCEALTESLDEIVEVYLEDWSGCILESEPEGFEDDDGEWIEPEYSDYTKYERGDILRELLGSELAQHI